MKKYLGSSFTAFAAIAAPFFVIIPFIFSFIVLGSEVSIATVFVTVLCVLCCALWINYIISKWSVLYAWGTFENDAVHITILLHDKFSLSYDRCRGCGIGYYRHALLNNKKALLGSNVYYIYLSLAPFDSNYKDKMNMWAASNTRIKVKYSKELYDYLIVHLPQKQARMLRLDNELFFVNKER